MSSIPAIASLLLLAAITPGPNNMVMMRVGALGGVRGALPAMAGVLLGGIAMLVLTTAGLGALCVRWPLLRTLVGIGGAAYLVWLGWQLICTNGDTEDDARLPAGASGLFGFQFFNPKAWVMLLTVTAALPGDGAWHAFARLAPLFVGISGLCLLLWVVAGRALTSYMADIWARTWIDRVLGLLLIASALLLFI